MTATSNEKEDGYFGALNYSLANEDTNFELSLLREPVNHVAAVAGSGSRVLPLIGFARSEVTCFDLAAPQLFLTELRIAAARAFDLAGYRAFLGYPPAPALAPERRRMFAALTLSSGARRYWERWFEAGSWGSPLYEGRWERTFKKLARINRALTGAAGTGLFETRTLAEQAGYLQKRFPHRRFAYVLRLLGNAAVFNALLYRGRFPRKNTPGSHYQLYEQAFSRLFASSLARENFFLQLAFFGEVRFAEGCPAEAQPEPFARAKEALRHVQVHYRLGDALALASSVQTPIDFYSLSDIASYLTGDKEREYLQLLRPALARGGRVVVRTYLHVPARVDTRTYEREALDWAASAREKVGVYAFEVYRLKTGGTPP